MNKIFIYMDDLGVQIMSQKLVLASIIVYMYLDGSGGLIGIHGKYTDREPVVDIGTIRFRPDIGVTSRDVAFAEREIRRAFGRGLKR